MVSIMSQQLYGATSNSSALTGLASGMDTDQLIQQLLSTTKNKINREFQAKQTLLNKQEAYRDVSKKLLDFQNKYFTYSENSDKNILSPSFFEANTFTSSSSNIAISGNSDNIKNFTLNSISSVASGASFSSTKPVSSTSITSDAMTAYTSTLAGESMTLNYKGTDYTITLDSSFGKKDVPVTLDDVVGEINKQLSSVTGLENLSAKVSANGKSVSLEATDGELKLTAVSNDIKTNLKWAPGLAPVSSSDIDDITGLTTDANSILTDKENYITFSLNGVQKKINMSEANTTSQIAVDDIQSQLDAFYGAGRLKATYNSAEHTFSFESTNNTDKLEIASISKDLGGFLGIKSGDSNRLNINSSLETAEIQGLVAQDDYTININGTDISITKDMSIKAIIDTINRSGSGVKATYSEITNTFNVASSGLGANARVDITDVSGNIASSLFGEKGVDYSIKAGTDTVINYTLNGSTQTITRSTEDVTIDGILLDLNKNSVTTEAVNFTVTENTDKVVEKMEEFIKDYNEIVGFLGNHVKERPNRAYQPLTPDQRELMEKDDIDLWEKEAKKGILFGDRNIRNVYNNMRSALTGLTSTSSLTAYDIGIRTISMDTTGKITFDKDKFKKALIENPTEVRELFTGTAVGESLGGISSKMVGVIRENVGVYGTKGILIDEAGMTDGIRGDSNAISKRAEAYDKKIEVLKQYMAREEQRYAKRFTALEKALSQLNAQSAVLYEQLS